MRGSVQLSCVLSMIAYEALMGQAQQVTLAAQAQTNAAVFRDQVGRRLTFVCPANVNINQDVYGTDVYTDTSPICAAAAHAGVFTHGTSTAVTIVMEGEKQSFTASTRNSVTSLAYGRWWGTYSFLRRRPAGADRLEHNHRDSRGRLHGADHAGVPAGWAIRAGRRLGQ
jgi:hypothetical protein